MKTKEEILQAKTAHEVLEWMKATPGPHDPEIAEHYNTLARKEFEALVGPDYDPDTHYDFMQKKKVE